jgi:hypothetical protein
LGLEEAVLQAHETEQLKGAAFKESLPIQTFKPTGVFVFAIGRSQTRHQF